jgi:hypothetical protein
VGFAAGESERIATVDMRGGKLAVNLCMEEHDDHRSEGSGAMA